MTDYRESAAKMDAHYAHEPSHWWRDACEKCGVTRTQISQGAAYQAGRRDGIVEAFDRIQAAES